MKHTTALIAVQAILVLLALSVVVLRCWTRLRFDGRKLTISDYLACVGWIFAAGWFISSAIATDIKNNRSTFIDEEGLVYDAGYLKSVWIAEYFFDTGVYWPKLSITAFYWHLIPGVIRSLRIALYAITAYLICCLLVSLLLNTLIAGNFSNNWSIDNQLLSAWNSFPNFITQWCMNFSTDLLLFCYPFLMLNHLMLRKEQKLALVGVFSLGGITLTVSLTRFIINNAASYQLDDTSGNTLCTAEMTTAVIVVCLPGLKKLIRRSKAPTQSDRDYGSNKSSLLSSGSQALKSRRTTQTYAEWGVRDDDIDLVPDGEEYLRMPDLVFLKD